MEPNTQTTQMKRASSGPQLQAWVLCESFYTEMTTRKHTLLGTFNQIMVRATSTYPVQHNVVSYLSFSDCRPGRHVIKISVRDNQGEVIYTMSAAFACDGTKAMERFDGHAVPFPAAGQYAFIAEVDDEMLVCSSFTVIQQ